LSRGGIVDEAGGVGWPALRLDPPLDFIDLAFEPIDPLLGRRLLALRDRASRKKPARQKRDQPDLQE
jgi:hypothetical protein